MHKSFINKTMHKIWKQSPLTSSPTQLDPERVPPAAYAWSEYLIQNTYTRLIRSVSNEYFELNILISQVPSKCIRNATF